MDQNKALGVGILAAASMLSGNAQATSANDAYILQLFNFCNGAGPFTAEQAQFCINTFPGGLASGTGAINASGGIQGAGSTSASVSKAGAFGGASAVEAAKDEEKKRASGTNGSADMQWGNFALSIAISSTHDERDTTTLETGYKSSQSVALAGLEYSISDTLVIGLGINTSRTDLNSILATGAGSETETTGLMLYATAVPVDDLYLGGYIGKSLIDIDTVRGIPGGFAIGSTEGDAFVAGVSFGYDWYLDSVIVGPYANVDYVSTDIDGYSESGGTGAELIFARTKTKSFTQTLGVRLSAPFETGAGYFLPELRAAVQHESENDGQTRNSALVVAPGVNIPFQTDSPDRNYYLFGAGATASISDDIQGFIDYEYRAGDRLLDTYTVSAGVRVDF